MQITLQLAGIAIIGFTLIGAWYWLSKIKLKRFFQEAEKEKNSIVQQAKGDSERILKEARLEAKEKMLAAKAEFEEKTREQKRELHNIERKLNYKAGNMDRKMALLETRTREIEERERRLKNLSASIAKTEQHLHQLLKEEQERLERISGMTPAEAKRALMKIMENEARNGAALLVRKIEEEARQAGLEKAKKIISLAIQKCASEHVVESTVSVVDLPNDEMKGRIIGREGRNIRALEVATGIDLIIDDTPEAVILSGFDPIRREIAKIAIERLIANGRIHPTRIEEVVKKVKEEFEQKIKGIGEEVSMDFGIHDLHLDLVRLLGKLKYRSSYGQNVLMHSKEVALIAGIMADELGVNTKLARRAGLLHDIGKAIDREGEGSHTKIGAELAHKYNESSQLVHCIEAHHFDEEPQSVEAVLVQAADSLSAARPGARREILETYIKRLEKLEKIADSFQGVSKAYAIQAGREVRIIVESDKVSDEEAVWLSKDIAKRIEEELEYPGEIKVTVIRETRAIEYAR